MIGGLYKVSKQLQKTAVASKPTVDPGNLVKVPLCRIRWRDIQPFGRDEPLPERPNTGQNRGLSAAVLPSCAATVTGVHDLIQIS